MYLKFPLTPHSPHVVTGLSALAGTLSVDAYGHQPYVDVIPQGRFAGVYLRGLTHFSEAVRQGIVAEAMHTFLAVTAAQPDDPTACASPQPPVPKVRTCRVSGGSSPEIFEPVDEQRGLPAVEDLRAALLLLTLQYLFSLNIAR